MARITIEISATFDNDVESNVTTTEIVTKFIQPAADRYGVKVRESISKLTENRLRVEVEAEGTDEKVMAIVNDLADFAIGEAEEVEIL